MSIEEKIKKLEQYLQSTIHLLLGDFVRRNAGYEGMICNILEEFTEIRSRYWDAYWAEEDLYIEFKKGRSIWLDLVRYSEIKNRINENASIETVTLFFIPDANRELITEILGIKTSRLIENLNISFKDAKFIQELNERVPRSLNAQASLTVNDIREICDFDISDA